MSPAADVPDALRRMVEATNAADNQAFLASFVDDAVIDDWGREFVGRVAIAGWNASENIGVQSKIEIVESVEGAALPTVSVAVSGGGYNGGGTFAVEITGDLINRLTIRG